MNFGTGTLQQLRAAIGAPALQLDSSGYVIDLNGAAERLLGVRSAETRGRHIEDLGQGFDFKQLVRDGLVRDIGIENADGWAITIAAVACPALSDKSAGFILLVETTRGNAPTIAAPAIVNADPGFVGKYPDPVAVYRDSRFVAVNAALLRYLGYTDPRDLVGRSIFEVVHPTDHRLVMQRMNALTTGHEQLPPCEERLLHRDGSILTAEITALEVTYGGEPSIIVVGRDTTEKARMHAQLAQADKLASLGTLAAGVAHEVNNPLTYVMFNLDMLIKQLPSLRDRMTKIAGAIGAGAGAGAEDIGAAGQQASLLELADEVAGLYARAREAAEGAVRVRDIVRDLKSFSRTDDDHLTLSSVHTAIETALNLASNEIKYRARIAREFGEVQHVMANPGRLSQVFLNIVVNAVQSLDDRGPNNNEIRITTEMDSGMVVTHVADTGCGIAPEIIGRIFDPFFTTKPPGIGSGLGLSISSSIVVGYGGTIEVTSHEGSGTCFTVSLPGVEEDSARPGSTSEPPAAADVGLQGSRILAIDDDPHIRSVFKEILARDFTVTLVGSGERAQEIIGQGQSFDLVLCGSDLAGISGVQLYEWMLGKFPALANRTVFVIGGALSPATAEFVKAMSIETFPKPFNSVGLRRRVRDWLTRSKAGQPLLHHSTPSAK